MEDSLDRGGKKIAIISKLGRKRKIGMDYIPKEKAFSKIPGHARGDLDNILDEMHKDGLIEYHKGKKCISINRKSVSEVVDLIEDEVPEYILDKLE